MYQPEPLRPGDIIRVITPASPVLDQKKLLDSIEELRKEGYVVELDKNVFNVNGYLAGTDQERAASLMEAFQDPRVKAIICSRGGYGSARLLPYLDLTQMARSRKMFVAFSDLTFLHQALNKRGLVTYHGLMALFLKSNREPWAYKSFYNLLKGDANAPQEAPKGLCLTPGLAEGLTTGGCLRLLVDSIGTPAEPDFAGKILFIEDTGEKPYRIDAMLTHLLNANKLQKCAGIVVGDLGHDVPPPKPTDPKEQTWEEVVRDRLSGLKIPVIYNYPIGHAANVLSFPLGIRAKLDANAGIVTY